MLRLKLKTSTICSTSSMPLKLKSTLGPLILRTLSTVLMLRSILMTMLSSDNKNWFNWERPQLPVKMLILMKNKLSSTVWLMLPSMVTLVASLMVLVWLWVPWISSSLTVVLLLISWTLVVVLMLNKSRLPSKSWMLTLRSKPSSLTFSVVSFPASSLLKVSLRLLNWFNWESPWLFVFLVTKLILVEKCSWNSPIRTPLLRLESVRILVTLLNLLLRLLTNLLVDVEQLKSIFIHSMCKW